MDTSFNRLNDPSIITEIHREASNSGHSYGIQLNNIKDIASRDLKTSYCQITVKNSENSTAKRPLPFGLKSSLQLQTHKYS